jgi:hypothetical protein
LEFGAWNLEFVWYLVLGIWDFPGIWCLEFGIFLEFGAWNLGFSQDVQKTDEILVSAVDPQFLPHPGAGHIDAVNALVGDGGNVFGRHIQA